MAQETGYPQGADEPAQNTERGISSVASGGNKNRIALIFLFIAVIMAMVFIVLGTGGGDKKPPAENQEQEFRSSQTRDVPTAPLVIPAEPPPLPRASEQTPASARTNAGPSDAERRAEARRRSPLLIFNQGESGGQSSGGPEDQTRGALAQRKAALQQQLDNLQSGGGSGGVDVFGGGGSQSGENEGFAERNSDFANGRSNAGVETVAASQLSDLSYRINQGKLLRGVLETAIQSDLPGLLRAVVAEDVYSANGNKLLIPRGSRLIGEYRSGLVRGQTRVFVVWTRLIEPNGIDVALGSRGTDNLGRAGLTGVIDTHFFKRFGGALLLSLIGSSVQAAQGDNTVVLNTSQSFSDAAEVALENSINIPPTIHVDQGVPIQVFVARDLDFGPVLRGR